MTLKEIASCALDEAVNAETNEETNDNEETADGIVETKNEDGTVNFEFSFTLDPEVVAKKAKAMPKGVKRDDLVDVELDDGVGNEEPIFADDVEDAEFDPDDDNEGESDVDSDVMTDNDEDPYNGVNTEDSANDVCETVFMDALDSIEGIENATAMDARKNSRHAQTPLENCRAKDPRFCPYHGIPAWTKHVQDAMQSAGVQGDVEVKCDNGRFTVTMKNIPGGVAQEHKDIIRDIMATDGVKNSKTSLTNGNVGVEFGQDFTKTDKTGRLNEWIDNFIEDFAADPDAEIDTDDFAALMEAQTNLEDFERGMNKQDPNDIQKYNAMVAEAEKKYHSLIAQQYFNDVTDSQGVAAASKSIQDEFDKAFATVHDGMGAVNVAKQAIFGGKGNFPSKNVKKGIPAFADTHDWAKKYNKVTIGTHYAHKDYEDATNGLALVPAGDIKAARAALADMDYKKDNYVYRAEAYPQQQKEFMQSFYDWAMQESLNTNNQYGIDANKIAAAWPNGRPQ